MNHHDYFIRGSSPGSIGRATRTGWINEEVFVDYLIHIVHHSRSIENKILFILDNHESHISLEAIDFARTSGIVLLTLPPHTSHRLQPLIDLFMAPSRMPTTKQWMHGYDLTQVNPSLYMTFLE